MRWPNKLAHKIPMLAAGIGNSDFPPTTQQVEVHEMYKEQLAIYQSQLNELLDEDLPAFNNLLKEKNIPSIIVVKTP